MKAALKTFLIYAVVVQLIGASLGAFVAVAYGEESKQLFAKIAQKEIMCAVIDNET